MVEWKLYTHTHTHTHTHLTSYYISISLSKTFQNILEMFEIYIKTTM
jgi:hypothetical protein